MNQIKLSFDNVAYWEKPTDAAAINNRIGKSVKAINTRADLLAVVEKIALGGHTFCSASMMRRELNELPVAV